MKPNNRRSIHAHLYSRWLHALLQLVYILSIHTEKTCIKLLMRSCCQTSEQSRTVQELLKIKLNTAEPSSFIFQQRICTK